MEPWKPSANCGRTVDDLSLDEWVGQALGSASMCWESVGRAGVFDSTRCGEIANALLAHLNEVIDGVIKSTRKAEQGAQLGLASTREMLLELEARGATGVLAERLAPHVRGLRLLEVAARELRGQLAPAVLDYRTVDR